MSAEALAWNEYTEHFGFAPKKPEHLIRFVRSQSHLRNLSFKEAKEFFRLQQTTKSPLSTDPSSPPLIASKLSIHSSVSSITIPPLGLTASSSHHRTHTPSLVQSTTSLEDQPSDSTEDAECRIPNDDHLRALTPDIESSQHVRSRSKIEELLKEQEMLELHQNGGIFNIPLDPDDDGNHSNKSNNINGDQNECADSDHHHNHNGNNDGDGSGDYDLNETANHDHDQKTDDQEEEMMERILIDFARQESSVRLRDPRRSGSSNMVTTNPSSTNRSAFTPLSVYMGSTVNTVSTVHGTSHCNHSSYFMAPRSHHIVRNSSDITSSISLSRSRTDHNRSQQERVERISRVPMSPPAKSYQNGSTGSGDIEGVLPLFHLHDHHDDDNEVSDSMMKLDAVRSAPTPKPIASDHDGNHGIDGTEGNQQNAVNTVNTLNTLNVVDVASDPDPDPEEVEEEEGDDDDVVLTLDDMDGPALAKQKALESPQMKPLLNDVVDPEWSQHLKSVLDSEASPRTKRRAIRPYSSAIPSISNHDDIDHGLSLNANDLKDSDEDDDDDDDDDDNVAISHSLTNTAMNQSMAESVELHHDLYIENLKFKIHIAADCRVIATTAASIIVSCGNAKEVFNVLRSICIDVKHDHLLPYSIPFRHSILQYDHVEAFLQLLGFHKNRTKQQWFCHLDRRCKTTLIDFAILECHKCLQTIRTHSKCTALIAAMRGQSTTNTLDQTVNNNDNHNISTRTQSHSVSVTMSHDHDHEDYVDPLENDTDSVQLYELIWSITHSFNNDDSAQDVLLLCYPLVTDAKHILLCLERRFFADDHDGRITISSHSNSSLGGNDGGDSTLNHDGRNEPNTPLSSTENSGGTGGMGGMGGTGMPTTSQFDRILSSFPVQARVIKLIRRWMTMYWKKDWDGNDKLQEYCRRFGKKVCSAYRNDEEMEPSELDKGKVLVKMMNKTMSDQKRNRNRTIAKIFGSNSTLSPRDAGPHGKKRKGSKSLQSPTSKKRGGHRLQWSMGSIGGSAHSKLPKDLIDVHHGTLAEQITMMQFAQFQRIHPRECLKQSWKDKDRKHVDAPNITKYIDDFNKLSKWIQSSILVADNVKIRGRTIKKWVKVEEELYALRNFQSLMAVCSALQSSPVFMLKDAWSLVAKKHIDQHQSIQLVLRSQGNWKNLRRMEAETLPPMLPFFGMFAQDVIAIEETSNKRTEDGSINWDALWRVKAAIEKHLRFQRGGYQNLAEDATLQRWMNKEMDTAFKLKDEMLYTVSKAVKKKDRNDIGKGIIGSPKRGTGFWGK